jgi:hypothetical protein
MFAAPHDITSVFPGTSKSNYTRREVDLSEYLTVKAFVNDKKSEEENRKYFTTWNITTQDFYQALTQASSSLSETERNFLVEYSNDPSKATEIARDYSQYIQSRKAAEA